MKKIQNLFTITKLFVVAFAVMLLASCSTGEEMIAPETAPAAVATETTPDGDPQVAGFTLSGVYTEISESTDCATCTYVVPKNATVVDGKELGFAAGSVICLDKAIKYKNLEFINLEGTSDSPIIISYCGK